MGNIKKPFEEPRLNVVTFEYTDIISTSYVNESDEQITTVFVDTEDEEPSLVSLGSDDLL